MLDERKASILRAVVEEYIQTAQPVGSGHAADAPGVRVSSATVRHEMAALENARFLAQPHTPAGPIPTAHGYRPFLAPLTPPHLARPPPTPVRPSFPPPHAAIQTLPP